MKTILPIIILLVGHFAQAELINLYCFNGSKQKDSVTLDDLIEMDSDYVLSFNFSDGKVEAVLKYSEDTDFTPLKILSNKVDEYGDVLLADLVLSSSRLKGGSGVNALRIQSYKESCEDKIISIDRGIVGGFAGKFTPNLSIPADLCFCTSD